MLKKEGIMHGVGGIRLAEQYVPLQLVRGYEFLALEDHSAAIGQI